jgi:hypothetical protein
MKAASNQQLTHILADLILIGDRGPSAVLSRILAGRADP